MLKKIKEFRVVDHGCDGSQYFQGHSIVYTRYTNSATGMGDTAQEALEDALEQLATDDWDIAPLDNAAFFTEYASDKSSTYDDVELNGDQVYSDWYRYISIDVR